MTLAVRPLAIPVERIREHAAAVDRDGRFPVEAVNALRDAGVLGLGLPRRVGGDAAPIASVVEAVEQVAAACASTGMVLTMHLVAAQTLVAGTPESDAGPRTEALRSIARGEHLTTLAYSEKASRSHFWAQLSRATVVGGGDRVLISTDKSWVTSAGHADSYITASGAPGRESPTETELYLAPADAPGIEVLAPFDGLGMRGNASSPVRYRDVVVTSDRRLGGEASGFGLMMSATLPWFVLLGAACSVGIAGAAIETGATHVAGARLEHLGTSLAAIPGVRARIAEAKVRHMQARALLYVVAEQVAAGAPEAQLGVMALKAAAAEMAIDVTDEVMRACGGAAFSKHLGIERNFRDARASSVMAPTTDVLRDLIGRALTGQELFA